ncbi:MAG: ElyC/SanA/YdcF family protein [Cyclobacteriaceae bacterium]|nr:YdcF family protein [Cyclobacteriaceae bacterium]
MRAISWLLRQFFYLFVIVILFVVLSNLWIVNSTKDKVFVEFDSLAHHPVALVLGTSRWLTSGQPNPFFKSRMESAATLFKQGKIKHFIVSGDNRTKYYNEPAEMQKALVKLGVPSSAITLDYAGLRTLDSIVRSKEIFGQNEITIVTQAFHSYRALFISEYYDIDAIAYVAGIPDESETEFVHWREYLARAKAVLDLYILKTEPRHLGQKEPIQL